MYCTNCGKEIDYEAILCDECLGKQMRERAAKISNQTVHTTPKEEFNPTFEEVSEGDIDFGTKVDPGTGYTENYNPETNYFDPYYQKTGGTGDKRFGFKRALMSVIFSVVSLYAVTMFFTILIELLALSEGDLHPAVIVILPLLILASIGGCITCLVLGIKSIKAFKQHSAETGTKPIPTLVLGIVGTVLGGEGTLAAVILAFYSFIFLLIFGMTAY